MPKSFHQLSLAVVFSLFVGASAGCGQSFFSYGIEEGADAGLLETATSTAGATATATTATASPAANSAAAANPTQPNFYQQAIDRASSAFTLSRSAQSQDDWRLVASRWQQAIDLMASVPTTNLQHAQAQKKTLEYRRNLTYAQQQVDRPTAAPNSSSTVVIHPSTGTQADNRPPAHSPVQPAPSVATTARSDSPAPPASSTNSGNIFYAPIIRREGNTPVIRVTFNGNQAFDMIVDTGASGTLITAQQAQALGVTPVAAAMVDTASQQGVTVPLGYVHSIEVNGAVATNVLVAIAGPQLGTGLLGHDFFGNYDVTIRENEVEFRERGQG